MWSHYTTDGSGFVIGYDKQKIENIGSGNMRLKPVTYEDDLIPVVADGVGDGGDSGLPASSEMWDTVLSRKSCHWSYEKEWRLIVELNRTIGTGRDDQHGQPINLIRVPNEAVVRVYYTERTPAQTLDEIGMRLADLNNRYGVQRLRKLILAPNSYAYVEETTSA